MKYISHSTKASTCSPRIACLCQDLSLSLYIMGMIGSPLCRCGAEEKTSDHLLCECEALATLIHTFLGSFWHGYVLGGVHGKRKVATATSWRHSFRYWYVYDVTCILIRVWCNMYTSSLRHIHDPVLLSQDRNYTCFFPCTLRTLKV